MNRTILHAAIITSLSLGISACASHRPVLSPNAHLARVGSSVAEREIDECMRRAEASLRERGDTVKEGAAVDTVTSTAVGAAAGGAGGAVVGRAGQGAAAGAAGGAVASLTHALLRGLFASKPPDPSYRGFVDRCLREKGYEPVGWK
jgi:outer membrane lipoprotein SlyB